MKFNTAISAMMEFINAFSGGMPRPAYETLLQMLNPFAPHLTEEMWEKLGHKEMLVFQPWPTFDSAKLVDTEITIVVSVNGLIIVDHISKLNHGICLVEQEICPIPKALVPPTLFLVMVKSMEVT